MAKRHSDALFIVNPGACNPSGIAHSIIEACREIRESPDHTGTDQIRGDAAIRLMVYQLAFLSNIAAFDHDLAAYGEAVKTCEVAS
jgi:hypothetical protein